MRPQPMYVGCLTSGLMIMCPCDKDGEENQQNLWPLLQTQRTKQFIYIPVLSKLPSAPGSPDHLVTAQLK